MTSLATAPALRPDGTGLRTLEVRDRNGRPLLGRKTPITVDDIWLG